VISNSIASARPSAKVVAVSFRGSAGSERCGGHAFGAEGAELVDAVWETHDADHLLDAGVPGKPRDLEIDVV
jgi:hypothetical protein